MLPSGPHGSASVQDVIDSLVSLGVGEPEAGAYVRLTMLGPSKAHDIANEMGLSRGETYRMMDRLVHGGLASATLTRPVVYEAAAPERVFTTMEDRERSRMESISRARSEIGDALLTLRGASASSQTKNAFKTIHGRQEALAVQDRMLREAKSSIRAIHANVAPFAAADRDVLGALAARRAAEGIDSSWLVSPPLEAWAAKASLARAPGLAVREIATERVIRHVIVDQRELLMWVVVDRSTRVTAEGDVAFWTDAEDFVGTQLALFQKGWDTGIVPPGA